MNRRARVIGLGQPAAGDDGVGLVVLAALGQLGLPSSVELCSACDASALTSLLEDVEVAVVVDAAVELERPGTVLVVSPEALEQAPLSTLSCHGISVGQALALSRALQPAGAAPRVYVVAIGITAPRRYMAELSADVAGAVPQAVAEVLRVLATTGCAAAVTEEQHA